MKNHKILSLIPARGGSKSINKKNIKDLNGKPLISWTIKAALNSKYINTTVVSTDDTEIAQISESLGAKVPFIRPNSLAGDSITRNEVVLHALKLLEGYDYIILLQPTSPLRETYHIDEAFELMIKLNGRSCVSVSEQHPSPLWSYKLSQEDKLIPFENSDILTRRQMLPKYYSLNGAIYICEIAHFLSSKSIDPFITSETVAYKMHPKYSIDLDELWQWKLAEVLLKNN